MDREEDVVKGQSCDERAMREANRERGCDGGVRNIALVTGEGGLCGSTSVYGFAICDGVASSSLYSSLDFTLIASFPR